MSHSVLGTEEGGHIKLDNFLLARSSLRSSEGVSHGNQQRAAAGMRAERKGTGKAGRLHGGGSV